MYYLVIFLPLNVTLAYYQGFDSPATANVWREGKREYVSFEVVNDAVLASLDDVIQIPIKRRA